MNELILRGNNSIPALYYSGVVYKTEPNAGKYERFDNLLTALKRGWGDCDDLCPWRAAEIRVRENRPADILVYWRPKPNGNVGWHIQVRHWPSEAAKQRGELGEVEDPSRLLGM